MTLNATTIMLADDHHMVRQGLRTRLEAEPDFCVVGETGDGLEALEWVKQLQPNVLVLDLMIPSLKGLEVARQLGKRVPHVGIVILSMYDDDGFVLEALTHGVSACVLKGANSSELVQAVRDVAAGRRYLSPPLSNQVIEAYYRRSEKDSWFWAMNILEILGSQRHEPRNII